MGLLHLLGGSAKHTEKASLDRAHGGCRSDSLAMPWDAGLPSPNSHGIWGSINRGTDIWELFRGLAEDVVAMML